MGLSFCLAMVLGWLEKAFLSRTGLAPPQPAVPPSSIRLRRVLCTRAHCSDACRAHADTPWRFWALFLAAPRPDRHALLKALAQIPTSLRLAIYSRFYPAIESTATATPLTTRQAIRSSTLSERPLQKKSAAAAWPGGQTLCEGSPAKKPESTENAEAGGKVQALPVQPRLFEEVADTEAIVSVVESHATFNIAAMHPADPVAVSKILLAQPHRASHLFSLYKSLRLHMPALPPLLLTDSLLLLCTLPGATPAVLGSLLRGLIDNHGLFDGVRERADGACRSAGPSQPLKSADTPSTTVPSGGSPLFRIYTAAVRTSPHIFLYMTDAVIALNTTYKRLIARAASTVDLKIEDCDDELLLEVLKVLENRLNYRLFESLEWDEHCNQDNDLAAERDGDEPEWTSDDATAQRDATYFDFLVVQDRMIHAQENLKLSFKKEKQRLEEENQRLREQLKEVNEICASSADNTHKHAP